MWKKNHGKEVPVARILIYFSKGWNWNHYLLIRIKLLSNNYLLTYDT